jgi:hypothetical protein
MINWWHTYVRGHEDDRARANTKKNTKYLHDKILYLYEWIGLTQKSLDFIWLYC